MDLKHRQQQGKMILRPPRGKEVIHLWIAIAILIVLSLHTLAVQMMEPLQSFFIPYTRLPIARTAVFILYLWLLALLWIAYRRWKQSIKRRRELETVISSISPDTLLVVSPERKIKMCNTSVKSMFDYEPEDVIGQETDLLYCDRRVTRESAEIAGSLQNCGFHIGLATGKRKNGETFPLEIITGVLSGQPGAVVLARDITERKQAEEALRISYNKQQSALHQLKQTQQQVIQHERLRILGKMASYIAHEFNNALTPIMGFSELILNDFEKVKNSDELHTYVRDINTAAKDASLVVNRLREFFKKREQSNFTNSFNLNDTINETISMTRPKWKNEAQSEGCDIAFDLRLGDIPDVSGNADEMREVLSNLIFNAVNAMPEGGTITISTTFENDFVMLRIRDTGRGMQPEVKKHCFEPFFSSNTADGSGLGLFVVSSIINRHNAFIECDSEIGKGTEFKITLPVSQGQQNRAANGTIHPPARLLRILVVDDEMLIRRLMVQFLENVGHTVETAGDGRKAIEIFKKGDFDLVITDWAMPEMNGFELSNAIKSENTDTPIVLMTGFATGQQQNNAEQTSADFILGKPLTRDELMQTINDVIALERPDSPDIGKLQSELSRSF